MKSRLAPLTVAKQGTRPGRKRRSKSERQELAKLVLGIRDARGLTQQELAAQIGRTWIAVHRWENGKTWPEPKTLRILRAMAGLPVEQVAEA